MQGGFALQTNVLGLRGFSETYYRLSHTSVHQAWLLKVSLSVNTLFLNPVCNLYLMDFSNFELYVRVFLD